ncbi:MAG: PA0069 family radical SAM protein [Trueperaceae bacterium]
MPSDGELTLGPAHRGRGANANPVNRFSELVIEMDESELTEDDLRVRTRYLNDTSRSVISTNSSPDIGFNASLNPYRGCEHGCTYCYARPTHEYLGLSAGLDFERIILVKQHAASLLEAELSKATWKPQTLMLSGITDPYQPVERKLRITRACLEVLARFRNPVGLITKNALVTRDIDVLAAMAAWGGVRVTISITTLDEELRAKLEPRTSTAANRLAAIEKLAAAGVPVGVNVAPILPGLTDAEAPRIIKAAAEAGASHAGFTLLRLPGQVAPLFEEWLERNAPLRKERVLNRTREVHAGVLDDRRFGRRMRGEGQYAEQIGKLFHQARQRAGIPRRGPPLNAAEFRVPGQVTQGSLFGDLG